jgi:hypothetical protein
MPVNEERSRTASIARLRAACWIIPVSGKKFSVDKPTTGPVNFCRTGADDLSTRTGDARYGHPQFAAKPPQALIRSRQDGRVDPEISHWVPRQWISINAGIVKAIRQGTHGGFGRLAKFVSSVFSQSALEKHKSGRAAKIGLPIDVTRDPVVVIPGIGGHHHADLPEVRHRLGRFRGAGRGLDDGKSDGGEDRDDGDDHKQFNQGEGYVAPGKNSAGAIFRPRRTT